ncbi:MAG: hypothetical protein U1A72_25570, partial [Sulfuritalea sp.]|nr:hypothetical protein [Sulfuritalea sp.]
GAVDMWIARLTATSPHTHSPAKSQPFLNLDFNVKTDRSDSNLDWNGLPDRDSVQLKGIAPKPAKKTQPEWDCA